MASSPQHEPTMEEILASIRKIISEDSSEPQAPAPAAVAAQPPVQADADVLELTQEFVEEPASPEPEPLPEPEAVYEPEPLPEPEAVYEPESLPEPEPVAEPAAAENDIVFEDIEPPAPVQEPAKVAVGGDIFSEKTRRALDDAFANINESIPEEAAPKAVEPPAPLPSVDAHTIEAVFERAVRETVDPVMHKWLADNSGAVIERMKPLIRDWLDEHFPAILEGAVRDEVARVAKARGGRH